MLEATLQGITAFLASYKYFFLIATALLQGRVVAVFAGFLINLKELAFWPTYLILVFVSLIPDTAYYLLGRFGANSKIAEKHKEKIDYLQKFWKDHPGKMIAFGKITMVFIIPVLILTGLIKFPIKKLFKYTITTDIFLVLVLLGIGYFFGYFTDDYLKYFGVVTILIILGFVFLFFVLKYLSKDKLDIKKDSINKE